MTDQSHLDVLDEIVLQQAVVRHSVERLDALIATYRDLVPTPGGAPRTHRKAGIKSLDAWVEWLTSNQPAYRSTIAGAVGNLSSNATPHVRKWREHMEMWADDQVPPTTLMSVQAPRQGTGRPPMIYFLWSQRYDVLPLFGVGPIRPDPDDDGPWIDAEAGYKEAAPVQDSLTEVQPLTGVVSPPQVRSAHGLAPGPWQERSFDLYDEIGEVRTDPPQDGSDGG